MKIVVDEDRCQGHALCQIAAPHLMKLRDDDGHAYVELPGVPVAWEQEARLASETCPEDAISLLENRSSPTEGS